MQTRWMTLKPTFPSSTTHHSPHTHHTHHTLIAHSPRTPHSPHTHHTHYFFFHIVAHHCPGVPIVLGGTNADKMDDPETHEALAAKNKSPITYAMVRVRLGE
jgi:hypothetical protein